MREMLQCHLLQVLALNVLDPKAEFVDDTKLEFLNGLTLDRCELQWFDALLRTVAVS